MFENIFKMPKFDKLCNDSRIVDNAYKVFVLKIFQKSVCVKKVFEVFASKRLRTIYLLKSLSCYFSFPLDSAILSLVNRKPYRWMFEGRMWVIIQ